MNFSEKLAKAPQTLFYLGSGEAVLVTRKHGRYSARRRRFNDAHAALDWSIKQRDSCFVYLASAEEPRHN